MPGKVTARIWSHRLLYSTSLLAVSLFLGQAALSIALVLFLASIPVKGLKNLSLRSYRDRIAFLPVLYGLVGTAISLLLFEEGNDPLDLLKYMPFVVIPVGVMAGRDLWKDYANLRILYLAFLLASLLNLFLSLFYGMFRWIINGNSIFITYNHLAEVFGVQPIYLSLFYLAAILLATELYRRETRFRKAYLLAVFPLFLGIVLLASRSSLAIAVLILMARFYVLSENRTRYVLLLATGLVMAITAVATVPTLRDRFLKFDKNVVSYSGTDFRLKIWKNALEVGRQSPVWGYGYSNSQEALQRQYDKVNFRRARLAHMNTHNQYLQTFLDNGMIGVTILLMMIFLPMTLKRLSFTAFSFWIIIALALVTESFFRRQFGVIFYVLFYSLFIFGSNLYEASRAGPGNLKA